MKITLNLASRTYLNRRALYGFYALMSAVLVVLLALSVFFHFRNHAQVMQLREHLTALKQEATGAANAGDSSFSPAAYEKLLADIRMANGILAQDSFRWTALLDRLEELVPETVAISAIQPDYKENSLNLTGQARTVADLQMFLAKLIASAHFSDVYLLQQARFKEAGPGVAVEAISFKLVVKGAF